MNEEQSYLRLKESIRAKDDEVGDVRPNYKIYFNYKAMLSFCLKSRKNKENKNLDKKKN